jgi:hypothetical protein
MHEGQGLRRQTETNWMTDPFYRAEPDDAPEDASVRYSVIAGILYLVIVAVVALIAGHKSAQVATIDSNPPVTTTTTPSSPITAK